ncbi:hypothetical protein M9H77_21449 [Catharanthus roseus]|uniref:Uncharacterized protein n=1 Tax=Catharanthus roseus TaxID=4058 RepID=A0ACC0AN23_CATRO|nr:hypothetical protein M9H77_21449 [Catharanthus roseus]
MDISRNSLKGSIPSSISRLQSLSYLNLEGNELSGSIQNSVENLTSLLEIQLGNNQFKWKCSYSAFSGLVAEFLTEIANLTTLVLYILNNELSRVIPEFKPYIVVLTSGNK